MTTDKIKPIIHEIQKKSYTGMEKVVNELQKGGSDNRYNTCVLSNSKLNFGHYVIISYSTEYFIIFFALFTKQYSFQMVVGLTAV